MTALRIVADIIRVVGAAMLIAFALVMLVPALGDRFSQWMLTAAVPDAAALAVLLEGGQIVLVGSAARLASQDSETIGTASAPSRCER